MLFRSLSPLYESLVTAILVEKSTIKKDEVTTVILQNEVLKRENLASSSDGSSLTLAVSRGVSGGRWSDKRLRGGWSKSRMRDMSKIRCYQCDELGYLARDCPQLRDGTRAIAATVSSDSEGDVLEISDEVSTSF